MNNSKANINTDKKPKLLDQIRQIIRVKHYSMRTEETYIGWIKRFVFYHNKKHPNEMSEMKLVNLLLILQKIKKFQLRLRIKLFVLLYLCIKMF